MRTAPAVWLLDGPTMTGPRISNKRMVRLLGCEDTFAHCSATEKKYEILYASRTQNATPILRRRGKRRKKTGRQPAAGFGAVDQCSWIIMRMIVRSVSRIPSLASVPMLRIVFSTPLTTMPSPP